MEGAGGVGGVCGPVGEGERADSAGVVIHTGVDGGEGGGVGGQVAFLTFETKTQTKLPVAIVHRRALNAEGSSRIFFFHDAQFQSVLSVSY